MILRPPVPRCVERPPVRPLRAFGRLALFAGLAVLAACEGEAVPPAEGEARIVAVPVLPLAGVVEAIAPEVDIVVLVPPGANPATHEPSLEDLRRAQSAAIYFELGHPAFVFESTWLDGLLADTDIRRVPLFTGCELVEDDYHAWLSAPCLERAARRIAGALRDTGAESDAMDARLAAYLERLRASASAGAARLGPHRGGSVVVLHPAWGYLLRPHGITQRSILSHGTGDPGPARLAGLIADARSAGVRRIFVQPQFNQSPARLVADEVGATLVTLDPLDRDPVRAIEAATRAFAAALEEAGTP